MAAVLATLQAALPAKLAELRVRYDIQDTSLEDVTRWLTHEPADLAVDKPPMVVVVEQESDALDGPMKLTSDETGGSLYLYRYRLGVFGWARGATYDQTATARQRLGLALREVLLQWPGIGGADPGTIVIDPLKITESYSGVTVSDASREIIAGTLIAVEYRAQEYLPPRTAGTVLEHVVVGSAAG